MAKAVVADYAVVSPVEAGPSDSARGPVIAGVPVSLKRRPLAIAFGQPLTLEPGEEPHAFAARLQDVCYALARQAEQALAQHKATMRP